MAWIFCDNCNAPQDRLTFEDIDLNGSATILCEHCGTRRRDDTMEERTSILADAIQELRAAQAQGAECDHVWRVLNNPSAATDLNGKPYCMRCGFGPDGERVMVPVASHPDHLNCIVNADGSTYPPGATWPVVVDGVDMISGPLPHAKAHEAIASIADPVRYQRRVDDGRWLEVEEEDIPHYREKGQPIRSLYTSPSWPNNYQKRVAGAHYALFHDDPTDIEERTARFLEEAIETAQAFGMEQADAHELVAYVFSRPVGEQTKEVGAAALTLASLCVVAGIDLMSCAEADLMKLQMPETIARIRAKRATRHGRGPLPGIDPKKDDGSNE